MGGNIGFGEDLEEFAVNVKTVGEMIEQLKSLPKELRVRCGFADTTDLVVFNRADPETVHLGFDEGGEWVEI